jgi:hypothetical protein
MIYHMLKRFYLASPLKDGVVEIKTLNSEMIF